MMISAKEIKMKKSNKVLLTAFAGLVIMLGLMLFVIKIGINNHSGQIIIDRNKMEKSE